MKFFQNKKVSLCIQWFTKDSKRLVTTVAISTFITMLVLVFSIILAPRGFPVARIVTIPEGATLEDVAQLFDERRVVASPFFFKVVMKLSSNETSIKAGDYFFEGSASVITVSRKISRGEYGLEPVRITILEGSTIVDIAALFADTFSEFDAENFFELVEEKEGYLFPDTYFFLPNVRERQVVKEMEENFYERIAVLQEEFDMSERSFEDLVVMASIIEKEAWKEKDRRLISGVLWNRIDIGMALQVDASFLYINGKNTYDLTYDDLDIDSPYNTYKYRGFPPTPICSPSLSSLAAAVSPDESPYLFYLADREGNTYYSLDFEGHKQYKSIYLD
ncbi:MAG: endolytic transglycosylase MltG [Candidatus Pacebacteria bacterium]|nr:endolytic transglycosylase MltG [Candidatus Paceibacterota bacterium]